MLLRIKIRNNEAVRLHRPIELFIDYKEYFILKGVLSLQAQSQVRNKYQVDFFYNRENNKHIWVVYSLL